MVPLTWLLLLSAHALTQEGQRAREPAPAPAEEPPEHVLTVLVLDPSGAPAPGVTVDLVDLGPIYEREAELVLQGFDIDSARARYGRRFIADGAGLVWLPVSLVGGLIVAEKGELWGYDDFDHHVEDMERMDVVLGDDLALQVRVRDATGAPAAGVPVALRYRSEDEVEDVFRSTTGPDGLATLRHLQLAFENRTIEEEGACVALALLTAEPVEVSLAPGPLPTGALELVLPPAGSLELRLEGPGGALLREGALVELEIAADRARTADEEWQHRYLRRSRDDRVLKRSCNGGRVVIERLGVGLELEVRVQPFGAHQPVEARGRGPAAPGERAVLRVPVVTELSSLTARLLRPDGSSWAKADVRSDLWITPPDGGKHGRGPRLSCDAGGRIRIEIEGGWPTSGRFELELWTDASDGGRSWFRREWEATLVPGTNDLGDLVLESLPIAAAGKVVDPGGQPIAGARVVLAGPDTDRIGWKVSDLTSPEGAFSLQAIVEDPEVSVAAQADGYLSRTVPLARGRLDTVIALSPGGGIEGSVIVADECAFEALEVTATNAETGAVERAPFDADGGFAFADLVPGLYEIGVVVLGERGPALRVPDVIVRPGETAHDPRLRPIDLRERLHTFTVTFQGADEEWLDLHVSRRASGMREYAPGEWMHERELVLTTAHPALDLRLTPRGFRTEELTRVTEDRLVVLRPGLAMLLRLVPPITLTEQEWLELVLEPRSGGPLPDRFRPRFWDGEHAEVLVPDPGTYAVRLNFLQQAVGDLDEHPLPLEPEIVLEIRDTEETQRFDLVLPPAALAAIEAARR